MITGLSRPTSAADGLRPGTENARSARPAFRAEIHDDNRPLHWALNRGASASEIRAELEKEKSALNYGNMNGHTPLHVAVESSWASLEVVQLLLAEGAEPNAQSSNGKTPLIQAVDSGCDSSVLKALLDAGADPNVKDKDGRTARDYDRSGRLRALLAARSSGPARSTGSIARASSIGGSDGSVSPRAGSNELDTAPVDLRAMLRAFDESEVRKAYLSNPAATEGIYRPAYNRAYRVEGEIIRFTDGAGEERAIPVPKPAFSLVDLLTAMANAFEEKKSPEGEVEALMSSSKSEAEWNANAELVKKRFGGEYPLFWYRTVVASGLYSLVAATWADSGKGAGALPSEPATSYRLF